VYNRCLNWVSVIFVFYHFIDSSYNNFIKDDQKKQRVSWVWSSLSDVTDITKSDNDIYLVLILYNSFKFIIAKAAIIFLWISGLVLVKIIQNLES